MISKQDLERLLDRDDTGTPVLSLFLDLSVNQNNKRTYGVFLGQKRAQLDEMEGGRGEESEGGIAVAGVLDRVADWIDTEFDEANRGVVIYSEIGGDWFEALQFPVPVQNRMIIEPRPVIAPLAQVIESYRHYGVILLDREHVRLLSVYLGTLLDEITVRADPIPTSTHVQAGGYSQDRYQRRKREETKHFFREFSREVEEFVARYAPDDLVILGTEENVANFREFLPDSVLQRVVHTGAMPVDEPAPEILARLEPHLRAARERGEMELLEQVRDRVAHDYLATAGFQSTLTALQEGKVDALVLGTGQQRDGVRCEQCGFVFARELKKCPYDGSSELRGVEVVEEMVRMAEGQGVQIAFAEPDTVRDLRGAAALLRF